MAVAGKKTPARPVQMAVSRRGPGKPVARRVVSAELKALAYLPKEGVQGFVTRVSRATSLQLIATERAGVQGGLIKDLARQLNLPATRLFEMLGVAKATAEKKAATNEALTGASGQAVLGLVRLLGVVEGIVSRSTHPAAATFDGARWLGAWLERPQPALDGRKPAELVDTPTGVDVVARLLGSAESGAYQ